MSVINEKMVRLIDRLIALTAEGKIAWETTVERGVYRALFPDEVITVAPHADSDDEDYGGTKRYVLRISDEHGETVESLGDSDADEDFANADYVDRRLPGLYAAARRHALHSERRIDELLKRLATA